MKILEPKVPENISICSDDGATHTRYLLIHARTNTLTESRHKRPPSETRSLRFSRVKCVVARRAIAAVRKGLLRRSAKGYCGGPQRAIAAVRKGLRIWRISFIKLIKGMLQILKGNRILFIFGASLLSLDELFVNVKNYFDL